MAAGPSPDTGTVPDDRAPPSVKSAAVVLVGPEQAANVGFAARTMACYGLEELRIVGSPGIALDGAARKTGKAALSTLEGTRYFSSLEEAIGDCALAFGFTRRARVPAQRIENLSQAAAAWRAQDSATRGKSALVFGRESQGLFSEETLSLTHLVRITTPSDTMSLNVSHALAIALHAFLGEEGPARDDTLPPAQGLPTHAEGSRTLQSLIEALERGGFFKGGKEEAQKQYVRILWQRLRPDARELDFLAGLLRNLSRAR